MLNKFLLKKSLLFSALFLTVFFGLLFFAKASFAATATYYSDFSTGADSNAGTTASPRKYAPGMSGWTGSATLSSGDVVVLKGGVTWTFTSPWNDLWTVPISNVTFMGGQRCGQSGSVSCNGGSPWGTGYAVLDGNGSAGARSGIVSSGKSYVTLDGLKIYRIEYCPSGGKGITLIGTMTNIEIKNCLLDKTGDQSVLLGPGSGSSHILFHDSITSNLGRFFMAVGQTGNVDDIQIYNNMFLGPGNWCGGPQGGVHGDGLMIGADCLGTDCLTNLKIHHNKFYGDWTQGATALIFLNNGVGPQGDNGRTGGNHVEIYDNQIAIDTDRTISPGFITFWTDWLDVKIYSNSFGSAAQFQVSSCFGLGEGVVTDMIIKNNIFLGCMNAITFGDSSDSTLTVDANFYDTVVVRMINGWQGGGTADCRTIAACQASPFFQENYPGKNGDPKYVAIPNGSIGGGNWHLQSTSPAIDAGTALSAYFTTDLEGTTRPVGVAWDIGAYEYISGADDTTPPSPPTHVVVS